MVDSFLSYLTLSITKTSVILRMTNGHPYGNMDLLRVRMIFCGGIAYIDVGTSIARPYGRGVVLLSTVFDIGNARHSRYVNKRRTLRRVSFASRLGGVYRKGNGGSIPRRRRLSLSENGNPFVRFADISPNRGISHCHFVTSPQRGAPLPYIFTSLNLFRSTILYCHSPSNEGKLLGFILL